MMSVKTVEQTREDFLGTVHRIADYWASCSNRTPQQYCDGVAFSILTLLDGCHAGFPATNISVQPHEEDEDFCKSIGDDWYETGMVFNDCYLHDLYYSQADAIDDTPPID